MISKIKNLLAHLFYIFLTCPILSPSIGGDSAYLFLIIPLVDIFFIKYLLSNINKKYLYISIILLAITIPYISFLLTFKILTILLVVPYINYTIKIKSFHLYKYITINAIIAILQFLLFNIFNIKILDPNFISEFLYGDSGLETGDTFAEGYLFNVRVSGLSREPGFFSGLMLICLLMTLEFKNLIFVKSFIQKLLFIIAIILAFSKISISFIAIYLPLKILRYKKFVERIPQVIIVLGVLSIMVITTTYWYDNFGYVPMSSEFHRTIGYYMFRDLDITHLLFGVGFRNIKEYVNYYPVIRESIFYNIKPEVILDNSGLATIVTDFGLIFLFIMIAIIQILKINSYKLLIFLVLTVNVNPFTTSPFVLIGIFYMLFKDDKDIKLNLEYL